MTAEKTSVAQTPTEDIGTINSRLPWWAVEAIAVVLAFLVAYIPLRRSTAGLSLSLTAAATVAYVLLTNEMLVLNRRQVRVLLAQVRTQQEDLIQQRDALNEARARGVAEQAAAEAARDASRNTYLEAVRSRYDATAPRVTVSCRRIMACSLAKDGTEVHEWPDFLEENELQRYFLSLSLTMRIENYGPTAVMIRNAKATFGGLKLGEDAMPSSWLLQPTYYGTSSAIEERSLPRAMWELAGMDVGQARLILGKSAPFGVACTFDIADLLNQVIDTHSIEFTFSAIRMDGSRARLIGPSVEVNSQNGHVATVSRAYPTIDG